MRLFVAADLDDRARQAIAAAQKRIGTSLGDASRSSLRWIRPEHTHLTLAFLGEITEPQVPQIVAAVSPQIPVPPFTAVFDSLGVFPPRGAPRVLWAGVGAGARELIELQREVADRLERTGVRLERRPYQPHLTLGRWRTSRPADARRALAADRHATIARAMVDRVTLYQSRLAPSGPSYFALARANLT